MKRLAYAAKIKQGKEEAFHFFLREERHQLDEVLNQCNITNFSIWGVDDLVFIYGEIRQAVLENNALFQSENFLNSFNAYVIWICAPGQQMQLMYENFGIVREDKTHIRHRVFVTRLKPGCADEYKRRHDELIASRNGVIDLGPDSNFSIWSDGDYVFGYDEIDTTMEKEETFAEHQKTIAWETQQLEIMDWITDDVDWLTHEHHSKIKKLWSNY